MWKVFNAKGNSFMLSVNNTDCGWHVLLTDFEFIWEKQITTADLFADFQSNNHSIPSQASEITKNLLEIVNNLQDIDVSVNAVSSTDVELILEKKYSVLKHLEIQRNIVYKFKLCKRDQETFKNAITIPTIQTVYYLEQQQKVLLSLIEKKDRELEEFRMEKGDISRADLKTEAFDPNTLNTKADNLFLTVFSDEASKSFWNKFSEKNGEIQPANLQVEPQPWNNVKGKRLIHHAKVTKRGAGIRFKNSN